MSKDDLSQPCLEYFELCLRGAAPALVNDGVAEASAAAAAAAQGWAARVVGGSRPLRPPCVVWPVSQCTLSAGCAVYGGEVSVVEVVVQLPPFPLSSRSCSKHPPLAVVDSFDKVED